MGGYHSVGGFLNLLPFFFFFSFVAGDSPPSFEYVDEGGAAVRENRPVSTV
jgi:hypothetical protein